MVLPRCAYMVDGIPHGVAIASGKKYCPEHEALVKAEKLSKKARRSRQKESAIKEHQLSVVPFDVENAPLDVLEKIALSTSPQDLRALCSSHPKYAALCRNEQFQRIYKRIYFPSLLKGRNVISINHEMSSDSIRSITIVFNDKQKVVIFLIDNSSFPITNDNITIVQLNLILQGEPVYIQMHEHIDVWSEDMEKPNARFTRVDWGVQANTRLPSVRNFFTLLQNSGLGTQFSSDKTMEDAKNQIFRILEHDELIKRIIYDGYVPPGVTFTRT